MAHKFGKGFTGHNCGLCKKCGEFHNYSVNMEGHNYGGIPCKKCGKTHNRPTGMKEHNYGGIPCRKCGKIHINPMKGRRHTEDAKQVMSESKLNEKNPMWMGDDVGKVALHGWIRNHKPKPELCECCNKELPYDLANISGEYKRDINDFEWLCRKCHMTKDKRLDNLHKSNLGHIPWIKGLTKETDDRVKKLAERLKGKEGYWKGKKRPEHSKRMKGKIRRRDF